MDEAALDAKESSVLRRRAPMNIADCMPEMIASLERQRIKWAAFCEEIRPQFESMPEARACKHHPSTMRSRLFEETCQESRMAGEFKIQWAPCPDCKSRDATEKVRVFWRKRGIPERVLNATFENFVVDIDGRVLAKGTATEWIKANGIFLMIRGTPGTGKGHLAAACLKAHGNGLWITHANMMSDLHTSYAMHTTQSLISSWQDAECLVIDELCVSVGGRDEESMFYQVISDRHDKRRPTIFTTNQTSAVYKKLLGFRLVDRILEDCEVINCTWESWRAAKK